LNFERIKFLALPHDIMRKLIAELLRRCKWNIKNEDGAVCGFSEEIRESEAGDTLG
jgi:hypothetical protein